MHIFTPAAAFRQSTIHPPEFPGMPKRCVVSAVAHNDAHALREVLRRYPRKLYKEAYGKNLLHVAAQYGSRACAKVLLAYGMDIDCRTVGWFQKTALHLAGMRSLFRWWSWLCWRRRRRRRRRRSWWW
jgi:Ankyrin repeats (3 copies)